MAGLDLFGQSGNKPEDILDGDSLKELQELSKEVKSVNSKLADKIAELTIKKNMLEMTLEPIKKELEHLRKLFIKDMEFNSISTFRRKEGGTFSKISKVNYTTNTVREKVEFALSNKRADLVTVPSEAFSTLCKELVKQGKILPSNIRKTEFSTLTVRGV